MTVLHIGEVTLTLLILVARSNDGVEEILRRKASRGWFSGEACSGDRLVWLSMLVHKPVYRWSAQLRKQELTT